MITTNWRIEMIYLKKNAFWEKYRPRPSTILAFPIIQYIDYCLRTLPLLCKTSKREVKMASLNSCYHKKTKSKWTTSRKNKTFIGIRAVFCLTKCYLILGVLICLTVINIVWFFLMVLARQCKSQKHRERTAPLWTDTRCVTYSLGPLLLTSLLPSAMYLT